MRMTTIGMLVFGIATALQAGNLSNFKLDDTKVAGLEAQWTDTARGTYHVVNLGTKPDESLTEIQKAGLAASGKKSVKLFANISTKAISGNGAHWVYRYILHVYIQDSAGAIVWHGDATERTLAGIEDQVVKYPIEGQCKAVAWIKVADKTYGASITLP